VLAKAYLSFLVGFPELEVETGLLFLLLDEIPAAGWLMLEFEVGIVFSGFPASAGAV
jgi:hypothetical protein